MKTRLPPLFVLAGGLGNRLREITQDRWPKPMVPVEYDGVAHPFLEFVLAHYAACGGREAILCTGHLGGQVSAHFGDGSGFGLHIAYDDAGENADTGARLAHALHRHPAETCLVACGDVFLELDPARLVALLEEHPRWDAVLAVVKPGPGMAQANVAADDDGRVFAHGAGMARARWLEAGQFALRAGALCGMEIAPAYSLTADFFPRLLNLNRLGSLPVDGAFFDIGTPAGYRRFATHVAQGRAAPLMPRMARGGRDVVA